MVKDEKLNEDKNLNENDELNHEENIEKETLEDSEVNEDMEFEGIKDDVNEKNNVMDSLKEENKNLIEENKKLNNELEALKDRLLRINAEYDNFRKRTEKEKKSIYTEACADVLKAILPVFDSLEMASKSEGNAEDIKKGIEITVKQFNEAFKKLNVEEIPSDGEFDPNYHNAIMHVTDENIGKNQIVEVLQKGFKRGDKVLRFSLVKVAN